MPQPWKIISSQLVIDHRWYRLRQDTVQLPNGRILDDYFVSERPEVAMVVALTPQHHVLLVRQYKHGAQAIVIELPAGIIDPTDANFELAARRELLEETGYQPGRVSPLAVLRDNATKDTNQAHLFLMEDCTLTAAQSLDPSEDIEVLTVPLTVARAMVLRGEITSTSSVAGILLACHRLGV